VERESAWNQVWHLPTSAPAPTGKEIIQMAARAFGVEPKYRVLNRPILKIVGLFNSMVHEIYEMLYQNDSPYLFDSTKFAREFGFAGTPYGDGMRIAVNSYRKA
jgi:nucleoside-diphosphate-sugar epimerase